ncbi:MAG: hypothetical protein QHH26_04100 [Armatimonadota bacterium]|nr:hypothetical protein [Armatimonadota bacterium]
MNGAIYFDVDYSPSEPMPVEKDAKIFEAGNYTDKGLIITEDDLDTIVRNFHEAPVKVEHTDSPLDPLGVVKRIWRRGKELFARLAFPADVAGFLERRGVKKLSVALLKDPLRLAEVSLVLNPRVPSAAMFGRKGAIDCLPLGARFGDSQAFNQIRRSRKEVNEKVNEAEKEIAELRFALKSRDVEAQIAEFKANGKLVPASEPFARAILLNANQVVTFSDGESTVAELFIQFLMNQPKVIEFSETAKAVEKSARLLTLEEENLLAKLGINREKLEKYAKE